MYKRTLFFRFSLSVIVLVSFYSANAQFFTKDRVYQGVGFAYLTDVASSDVFETSVTKFEINPSGEYDEVEVPVYFQSFGISLITVIYRIQYNFVELESSSFSLGLEPSIGLSYVLFDAYKADEVHAYTAIEDGYGIINIPLFLGYEGGLGSTKDAGNKAGYFVKLGVEVIKSPIFIGQTNDKLVDGKEFNWSFWAQPVISTGVRYTNRKQQLSEVNLKFGFKAKQEIDTSFDTSEQLMTYHARISFFRLF